MSQFFISDNLLAVTSWCLNTIKWPIRALGLQPIFGAVSRVIKIVKILSSLWRIKEYCWLNKHSMIDISIISTCTLGSWPPGLPTCKNLSSNLSFNSYDLILTQVRFCQNSVLPNSLRVAPRVLSFKEKSQKFVNYQLLF